MNFIGKISVFFGGCSVVIGANAIHNMFGLGLSATLFIVGLLMSAKQA